MFRTTLPDLIFWNLLTLLGLLGLVWGISVLRQRYQERKSLRQRFSCVICGTQYHDDSTTTLVKCPRCGRLNERGMATEL
jgi:ribosomal protein L37AE/L43A